MAAAAATPPSVDVAELRAAVAESLAAYIYANAIFFAERLFAVAPTPDALHLLAHCYHLSGDAATAYRLLRGNLATFSKPSAAAPVVHSGEWRCMYLYGVVCCACRRYHEAERLLSDLYRIVTDASVAYWIGVCRKHLGQDAAGQMFVECFTANPRLFAAYEEHLKLSEPAEFVNPYGATPAQSPPGQPHHHQPPPPRPKVPLQTQTQTQQPLRPLHHLHHHHLHHHHHPSHHHHHHLHALHDISPHSFLAPSPEPPHSHGIGVTRSGIQSSSRAPMQRHSTPTSEDEHAMASGVSWPLPHGHTPQPPPQPELPSSAEGASSVLAYLQPFAQAAALLHRYRCGEAFELLRSPSFPEHESGWTLTAMALAMFHNGNVAESAALFARLREREPWRLNETALVYYSTALWQLKSEGALGLLSQVLVNEMPVSAVTLCVVANCYSLVKEPKQAMCMLERAKQVDPYFAYANTLRGYELLSLNRTAEAEAAFNEAISIDSRQYVAYAGLGELFFRLEKDQAARLYYKHAMHINPLPTITNRYAATFHRRNASDESLREALHIYTVSLTWHPNNLSGRHQRADVLIRLREYDEAFRELCAMQAECPKEAMVYVTMAKCLHLVGDTNRAIQAYHKAMDLDPRRTGFIKQCLDRLAAETAAAASSTA